MPNGNDAQDKVSDNAAAHGEQSQFNFPQLSKQDVDLLNGANAKTESANWLPDIQLHEKGVTAADGSYKAVYTDSETHKLVATEKEGTDGSDLKRTFDPKTGNETKEQYTDAKGFGYTSTYDATTGNLTSSTDRYANGSTEVSLRDKDSGKEYAHQKNNKDGTYEYDVKDLASGDRIVGGGYNGGSHSMVGMAGDSTYEPSHTSQPKDESAYQSAAGGYGGASDGGSGARTEPPSDESISQSSQNGGRGGASYDSGAGWSSGSATSNSGGDAHGRWAGGAGAGGGTSGGSGSGKGDP